MTQPVDTTTTTDTDTEPQGDGGKASREAARYRTERNEARTALEAATERIAALQRADAERLAGGLLAEPGDLWALGGTELADVLDDDGNVSADAVTALAETITKSRPGLRKPSRAIDPSQGRSADVATNVSWSSAFRK